MSEEYTPSVRDVKLPLEIGTPVTAGAPFVADATVLTDEPPEFLAEQDHPPAYIRVPEASQSYITQESSRPRSPLELFNLQKLTIRTSYRGITSKMKLINSETGEVIGRIERLFNRSVYELNNTVVTYLASDASGAPVCLIHRPVYLVRPVVSVFEGDNNYVKVGEARMTLNPLNLNYILEIDNKEYAKFEGVRIVGRYEVFTREDKQWIASAKREMLGMFSAKYDIEVGEITCAADLKARAIAVAAIVNIVHGHTSRKH